MTWVLVAILLAIVALVGSVIVLSLPDLRRYLRLRRM